MQAALARALAGRAWSYAVASIAMLALTAAFGALVDAGWTLAQAMLGGALAALLVAVTGLAVQQRSRQGSP